MKDSYVAQTTTTLDLAAIAKKTVETCTSATPIEVSTTTEEGGMMKTASILMAITTPPIQDLDDPMRVAESHIETLIPELVLRICLDYLSWREILSWRGTNPYFANLLEDPQVIRKIDKRGYHLNTWENGPKIGTFDNFIYNSMMTAAMHRLILVKTRLKQRRDCSLGEQYGLKELEGQIRTLRFDFSKQFPKSTRIITYISKAYALMLCPDAADRSLLAPAFQEEFGPLQKDKGENELYNLLLYLLQDRLEFSYADHPNNPVYRSVLFRHNIESSSWDGFKADSMKWKVLRYDSILKWGLNVKPRDYNNAAAYGFVDRKYTRAAARWMEASERDPSFEKTYYRLAAQSLFFAGKYGQAAKLYEKGSEVDHPYEGSNERVEDPYEMAYRMAFHCHFLAGNYKRSEQLRERVPPDRPKLENLEPVEYKDLSNSHPFVRNDSRAALPDDGGMRAPTHLFHLSQYGRAAQEWGWASRRSIKNDKLAACSFCLSENNYCASGHWAQYLEREINSTLEDIRDAVSNSFIVLVVDGVEGGRVDLVKSLENNCSEGDSRLIAYIYFLLGGYCQAKGDLKAAEYLNQAEKLCPETPWESAPRGTLKN